DLGGSPLSSVANVIAEKFSVFTLGNWLIVWNCVLIIGQIILLRKKFNPVQLLQIPLSFMFGWFTDFGVWCASFIPVDIYPVRLIMVMVGIVILGFGITLCVIANVVMNSGEAFVKAVSDTIHKNFGNVKIAFDIGCVIMAVILSLMFFNFKIVGTREGTIIAALCTGLVVKIFSKLLHDPAAKLLTSSEVHV
ncbi:MAG: YitT family protein, partial [Oscillospiraceae bacterium]|nr:YitT family protein [Oscillospiraceae bacterium]